MHRQSVQRFTRDLSKEDIEATNKKHKDLMKTLTHARTTIAEGRLIREMLDKAAKGDAKGLKDAVDSEFTDWSNKKISVGDIDSTLLKFATSASLGRSFDHHCCVLCLLVTVLRGVFVR